MIFAAVDSKLVACFGLSDSVKEESIQVIQDLQKHNVKVFLMSGDALGVCDKIGTEIGIPSENIYSRCLPKDKAQKIKDLQAQNEVVAMVGDGVSHYNNAMYLFFFSKYYCVNVRFFFSNFIFYI